MNEENDKMWWSESRTHETHHILKTNRTSPTFCHCFFFPVVGGPVVLGGHGLLYQYVHSCWVD